MTAKQPLHLDAAAVARALPHRELVDALARAFQHSIETPHRSVHVLREDRADRLLLMPAWQRDGFFAVKIVTVLPNNASAGVPTIQGLVVLGDATSGRVVATLDGGEITRRRTACASALAARVLARDDAAVLALIGTGMLVLHCALAHASVRPITAIRIWGRSPDAARARVQELEALLPHVRVTASATVAAATRGAAIVTCATSSREPLVTRNMVDPGTHVDLVGSYSPEAREAATDLMTAARVFVDTRPGALTEAGDILIPVREGALTLDAIQGDLAELVQGTARGRTHPQELTVFKSVGSALEDLAAAELAYTRAIEAS